MVIGDTEPRTAFSFSPQMKPKITEADLCRSAKRLGTSTAEVETFISVETKGKGFDDQDRPVILFERHYFHKLTHGKYDESHPHISNAEAGGYNNGGSQYARFSEAFELDRDAAMKSASWGLGQVMGYNYAIVGFATVDDFVNAMKESEGRQLDIAVEFILHNGLADELRRHDWAGFARGYNGPTYKKNAYDTKLAAAYAKFSKRKINCSNSESAAVDTTDKQGASANLVQPAIEQTPNSSVSTTAVITKETPGGTTSVGVEQNVAVQKEDAPDGLFSTIWKKLTVAIGSVGGVDAATDYASRAQTLGLSGDFWKRLVWVAAAGLLIWLGYEIYEYFYKQNKRRALTIALVNANSTPQNIVAVITKDQIADYEAKGWKVVTR